MRAMPDVRTSSQVDGGRVTCGGTPLPPGALAPWLREGGAQEAGKDDGYSNPQIRIGDGIREPLRRLAAQLEPAR
jgi:hypothetical protein